MLAWQDSNVLYYMTTKVESPKSELVYNCLQTEYDSLVHAKGT
jgi:hypothetical protein